MDILVIIIYVAFAFAVAIVVKAGMLHDNLNLSYPQAFRLSFHVNASSIVLCLPLLFSLHYELPIPSMILIIAVLIMWFLRRKIFPIWLSIAIFVALPGLQWVKI